MAEQPATTSFTEADRLQARALLDEVMFGDHSNDSADAVIAQALKDARNRPLTGRVTPREYIQLERAMQQAEMAWRHEPGGSQRAAEMRRAFSKLWNAVYPPAELAATE